MRTLTARALLCAALIAGCGTAQKKTEAPPAASETEPTPPALEAGVSVEAPSPAPATPAVSTAAPPPAPVDPCDDAGAEFEKRARPAIKECYREAKKKKPNLEGSAQIVINVDASGKVSSVRSPGKSDLGDDTVKCMVKGVKATPFADASKCNGKTLTIPVRFPSR